MKIVVRVDINTGSRTSGTKVSLDSNQHLQEMFLLKVFSEYPNRTSVCALIPALCCTAFLGGKLHSYLFLQKAMNFLTVERSKLILPGRRVISSTPIRRLKRGVFRWHLAEKLGVQPNFPTLTHTNTIKIDSSSGYL